MGVRQMHRYLVVDVSMSDRLTEIRQSCGVIGDSVCSDTFTGNDRCIMSIRISILVPDCDALSKFFNGGIEGIKCCLSSGLSIGGPALEKVLALSEICGGSIPVYHHRGILLAVAHGNR